MTTPTLAARDLSNRLAAKQIRIKHTNALDLIAAGCGFPNRHHLAQLTTLPTITSVNARLLASTALTLARHDENRRQIIINETSAVLVPPAASSLQAIVNEALGPRSINDAPIVSAEFAALPLPEQMNMLRATLGDVDDFDWNAEFSVNEPDLDYDRFAIALNRLTGAERVISPLELAVLDGVNLLEPYLASLSLDPEAPGSAVIKWISDVQKVTSGEIPPHARTLRDLLTKGNEAISNILHWIEEKDMLRIWRDVAAYPAALDTKMNAAASGMETDSLYIDSVEISVSSSDLEAPDQFLKTANGLKIVDHVLRDTYFTAWEPSRSPLSDEQCTKIASKTLTYLREAKTPQERRSAGEQAIIETLRYSEAEEVYHEDAYGKASELITEIQNGIFHSDFEADFDEDLWLEVLEEVCCAKMREDDTSKPADMICNVDRAEIIFHIKPADHDLEDMCSIAGPFLNLDKVRIDRALAHGLAVLGYTTDEFQAAFQSTMPHEPDYEQPAKRTDAIVTLDQIEEMVENACSTYFQWVAYAQVQLTDLFNLDLTKPIAFSQVAIAAYNLGAGTFQDVRVQREFIVQDGVDGRLEATDVGYSPNEICGLVGSYYAAELYDPEHRALEQKLSQALKLQIKALRLTETSPGFKIHWTEIPDEEGHYEASVGVRGENGYRLLHAKADKNGSITTD